MAQAGEVTHVRSSSNRVDMCSHHRSVGSAALRVRVGLSEGHAPLAG